MESRTIALTGNEAVAEAMRQINPDVVAAYPITPQTEIVQIYSGFVADGLVDTEMVAVESEHSAMSATVGAAAAGIRAMTATSSQGLALMWEIVYIAASLRLPIVMPVVNRALSGNINIHCDHSDTMGARDSGWIQIYSENSQEAYDNMIQAVRIAEKVNLPAMVTTDGFIISHAMEGVNIYPDQAVRDFIGERKPMYSVLNLEQPITVGPLDLYDYYFEHKRSESEAMRTCQPVILEVADEFAKTFGTQYGLFEEFMMDDAEFAITALGSTAGTAKQAILELREKGIKAGMLKLRVFRPFPFEEIGAALSRMKAVAVMDRAEAFSGWGGPTFAEIRSALYESVNGSSPKVVNYIYGLGGRDVKVRDIQSVFSDLQKIADTGQVKNLVTYLGVRE